MLIKHFNKGDSISVGLSTITYTGRDQRGARFEVHLPGYGSTSSTGSFDYRIGDKLIRVSCRKSTENYVELGIEAPKEIKIS